MIEFYFVRHRDVRESDEGAYVCRAANEGGYSEERVWLLMQSKGLF